MTTGRSLRPPVTVRSKTGCSCAQRPMFPLQLRAKAHGLERIVSFMAGFRCERSERDRNDGAGHGVAAVEVLFAVRGPKGAVEFLLDSGWYPTKDRFDHMPHGPMANQIGYHAKKPLHGEERKSPECRWINGPCYAGHSSLNADRPWTILREQGEEALWDFLEDYYRETFGKGRA